MPALLDQRPLTGDPRTIDEAITLLTTHASAAGRFVTELKLNGRVLADAEIDALRTHTLVGTLEGISTDTRLLAQGVLSDLQELLTRLPARQDQAGVLLQKGDIAAAAPVLQQIITDWQTIRTASEQAAALLNVSFQARAGGTIASLVAHLGELRRALASQDWSALSDTLRYDLGEDARAWRVAISSALA